MGEPEAWNGSRVLHVTQAWSNKLNLPPCLGFFFSGRRRHTSWTGDWSSDVCSSDLIQLVTLSRNFGKEAALLAGLDHARLGAVLFMDGDGQHPPDLVETLVSRWLDDDYDVVFTAKAHRENEPWLRRTGVHWFYALINWGQRQPIPEDAGDFRLLSPRAAAALRQMPERNRFFKGMSSWIGFRQARVDYEPALRSEERRVGKECRSWGRAE